MGCSVRAFDADHSVRQFVGEAKTDTGGSYEIVFEEKRFSGSWLAREWFPDLFVEVYDDGGALLGSMRDCTHWNARRESRIDVILPAKGALPGTEYKLVGGGPVDRVAAAQLHRDELIQLYAHLRGRAEPIKRMDLARRAFPKLFLVEASGGCGMGWAGELRAILSERLVGNQDLAVYDDLPAGSTEEWFYTENIAVKYTTDEHHPNDRVAPAPPMTDEEFIIDGISFGRLRSSLDRLHVDNRRRGVVAPLYVQKVGLIAEYALSQYLASPFSLRDPRTPGMRRVECRILAQPANYLGRTLPWWGHFEVAPPK